MNLGGLRARKVREWVILLLLPLLSVRLLVPAGFMPSFGAGLDVSMQMCHGDAKSSIVVRLTGGTHDAPNERQANHDAPCVFAATAAVAPPACAMAPLAGATPPVTFSAPRIEAPDTTAPHRPQSPRAPPSHV